MKCPRCQQDNPREANFCLKCAMLLKGPSRCVTTRALAFTAGTAHCASLLRSKGQRLCRHRCRRPGAGILVGAVLLASPAWFSIPTARHTGSSSRYHVTMLLTSSLNRFGGHSGLSAWI
jgi:hypothetical protein